ENSSSLPSENKPKYSAWTCHRSPIGTRNTTEGAQMSNRLPCSLSVSNRTAESSRQQLGSFHPNTYAAFSSVASDSPEVGVRPCKMRLLPGSQSSCLLTFAFNPKSKCESRDRPVLPVGSTTSDPATALPTPPTS